jgi:hypothetical protein
MPIVARSTYRIDNSSDRDIHFEVEEIAMLDSGCPLTAFEILLRHGARTSAPKVAHFAGTCRNELSTWFHERLLTRVGGRLKHLFTKLVGR